MKTCNECGTDKPLDSFGVYSKIAGGKKYRRGTCKPCKRPAQRQYVRKSRYGIDNIRLREMIESQGGRCAICGTTDPGDTRTWRIDHDHACCPGKTTCGQCVRSLLCDGCNKGIGHFKDNPETLMAAAAYLLQRTNLLEEINMAYGNSSSDGVYGGNVDTAQANVGNLSGAMFNGTHGPDNAWRSEKGTNLGRWEVASDMTPDNSGDARFNGEITGPKPWEASLKPHEGLTRGTDKHMPR